MNRQWFLNCLRASLLLMATVADAGTLRIATFNASMEGGNYVAPGEEPDGTELMAALARGDHPQLHRVAAIIRRVRPDILLLNEFDYTADPAGAIAAFRAHYLEARRDD
ncbi:MAG TPA: endonuclease/exonuclease/phosphatase family protein, partial [Pseudohaliea sp.]|nr:endonuclease/exonuclease/phosphatase family protein [Pseudohaliea sp.]